MGALKAKRIKGNILSQGQNRLLKDFLKQLLGSGLIQSHPHRTKKKVRAVFLKDALNSKTLDTESSV